MVSFDLAAPIRFLITAYDPADWIAVLLKNYRTGDVTQRVMPISAAVSSRVQEWLGHRNANGWNVFVSVNNVRPGRSRARRAIAAVRHVFLEEDADGMGLLAALLARPDLPPPSYVLHSSPGRLHVFWRVRGFDCAGVETLQKALARQLRTDTAATSCAQTTRVPGFENHKHAHAWHVTIEYLRPQTVLTAHDFPLLGAFKGRSAPIRPGASAPHVDGDRLDRARQYLRSVEPAIAGEHGDQRTFRICCRVARGFALSGDEALAALAEWNARCQPPWSERELREKVRNACRYGREPVGGLLNHDRSRLSHA